MRSLFFCASIAPNGIEDGTENLDFFFSGDDANFEQLGNNYNFFQSLSGSPKRMDLLFMEVFGVFVVFVPFCFMLI